MSLIGQDVFRQRSNHLLGYLPVNLLLWRFTYPWLVAALPYYWSSGKAFLVQRTSENTTQSRERDIPLTSCPWNEEDSHIIKDSLQQKSPYLGSQRPHLDAWKFFTTSLILSFFSIIAVCLLPTELFSQSVIHLFCLFVSKTRLQAPWSQASICLAYLLGLWSLAHWPMKEHL